MYFQAFFVNFNLVNVLPHDKILSADRAVGPFAVARAPGLNRFI